MYVCNNPECGQALKPHADENRFQVLAEVNLSRRVTLNAHRDCIDYDDESEETREAGPVECYGCGREAVEWEPCGPDCDGWHFDKPRGEGERRPIPCSDCGGGREHGRFEDDAEAGAIAWAQGYIVEHGRSIKRQMTGRSDNGSPERWETVGDVFDVAHANLVPGEFLCEDRYNEPERSYVVASSLKVCERMGLFPRVYMVRDGKIVTRGEPEWPRS